MVKLTMLNPLHRILRRLFKWHFENYILAWKSWWGNVQWTKAECTHFIWSMTVTMPLKTRRKCAKRFESGRIWKARVRAFFYYFSVFDTCSFTIIMADNKDSHTLVPRTHGYVDFHGKRTLQMWPGWGSWKGVVIQDNLVGPCRHGRGTGGSVREGDVTVVALVTVMQPWAKERRRLRKQEKSKEQILPWSLQGHTPC